MTLGQFLEMRRVHLRLTQREAADRIGCTNAMVSLLENDLRTPSVATLHAFAQALDVAPAILFVLASQSKSGVSRFRRSPTTAPAGTPAGRTKRPASPHQDHLEVTNAKE